VFRIINIDKYIFYSFETSLWLHEIITRKMCTDVCITWPNTGDLEFGCIQVAWLA
jgi:hypothetical protein